MSTRAWLVFLWVWWVICAILFLVAVWLSFLNECRSVLSTRHEEVAERERSVWAHYADYENRMAQAMDAQRDALLDQSITTARLASLRTPDNSDFRIYYVNGDGAPCLDGDQSWPCPPWLIRHVMATATDLGAATWVRPTPPGMQRFEKGLMPVSDEAAPATWFALAMRGPMDAYFIIDLDLRDKLGAGLETAQRLRYGLDDNTHLTTIDHHVVWARDTPWPESDKLQPWPWQNRQWSWVFRPFQQSPVPSDEIEMTVDNGPILSSIARTHAEGLAGGLVVLMGFAVALAVASRAMRREVELAALRSNFTAMVSHELKTPVTALCMYSDILRDRLIEDPDKVNEYHAIMQTESRRLKKLIENLLDLGKIERGQRAYHLASYDLNRVVLDAVAQAAPGALALTLELAPDLPAAWLDPEVTIQAVGNLVENAFKYGGPEVTVATRVDGVGVAVDVMDRGPGIPPAQRQNIFEPYVRLQQELRRETKGTGLGLALVEGQGGRVYLADRPGGGSIFTLNLPTARSGRRR